MSFYNGILNHDDIHESSQAGLRGPRGLPGPKGDKGEGYKLDANNDYDIQNKKLTNVKNGDNDNDVMVKSQIEGYVSNKTQYLDGVLPAQVTNNKAVIYSPSGGIHSNGFYLRDQNGQEAHFINELQDLNQCRLYIPNLKDNDSYGGRLKSSVVVTSINQTIEGKKIFHDIEVPTPTIDGHANNKAYVDNEISKISDASDNSIYVKKSGDKMIGDLILPKYEYPIQGDLNKVISYESMREIFLSRRENRPMRTNLDMPNHTIDNVKNAINKDQSINKGQFDNELVLKADKSDLSQYLKTNGSYPMKGTLQMNGNRITGLTQIPYYNGEAVNKRYVDSEISKIPKMDTAQYLRIDGSRSMTGNLNMDNHLITNLKNPENDSDAINKRYFDNNMIDPSHIQKNILSYIMVDIDQTSSEYGIQIDRIDDYQNSFHSYNKKVIYLKLLKNGNNYRSRIGYNIFRLIDKSKNKYYTAVIEWITTDNNAWTKMQIFNNITSGSILNNQTKKFENGQGLYYTRSIVQFEVLAISSAPIYLLSTIHIDSVNPTYPERFSEVYNIIYGVNNLHSKVLSNVYDYHDIYDIKNNKMTMNVDIDMANKSITGLKPPWSNSDAVNKKYHDDDITPFKNNFQIYNTRIRIEKDFDLGNHALRNISNLNNGGYDFIYGKINQNKIFTSSDIQLSFRQMHIMFIRLHVTRRTLDKSDVIEILNSVGNKTRFTFTYPKRGGYSQILIDRYFTSISRIQVANYNNIGFLIGYKLFR